MNVKGINSCNIINIYNKNQNRVVDKGDSTKAKDRIEISELGKSLTNYSLDEITGNNTARIMELKNKVENGTYNVDARLTAKSILDSIRESKL
ncbi:flagellar biosynthesis anti-sigma factor FlgM [Clostridium paraputrificum]|uniref:flagellar biosynthesis anti-sigma factor FlgM n=1 Tax=Clostridium TaxID=1485 RepID=UPI003D343FF6